jgi:Holliday junction DNA helicase RuvB
LVEADEPVGVETLASALSESVETLEENVEPFLLRQGFINRTSRGRVATEKARQTLMEVA